MLSGVASRCPTFARYLWTTLAEIAAECGGAPVVT